MKVYISGPIQGYDLTERIRTFNHHTQLLLNQGHDPVNPMEISACKDQSCEGDKTLDPHGNAHTWACYLKYDLIALLNCDAIYLLKGWEKSKGAMLELYLASLIGLKVMHSAE